MILQPLKMLLLGLVGIFRRALCCFSRRRKPSFSERADTLEAVNVVRNDNQYSGNKRQQGQPQRDWNSWDDSPRTVEEHIEQYRQRIAKPTTPQQEEPEPDFFSELTPVIQPQPKYFLGSNQPEKTDFSRLQAETDVPVAVNADLEDWQDDERGGWEELDAEQAKTLIREQRREMRHQRQKRSQGIEQGAAGRSPGIVATRLQGNPRPQYYI